MSSTSTREMKETEATTESRGMNPCHFNLLEICKRIYGSQLRPVSRNLRQKQGLHAILLLVLPVQVRDHSTTDQCQTWSYRLTAQINHYLLCDLHCLDNLEETIHKHSSDKEPIVYFHNHLTNLNISRPGRKNASKTPSLEPSRNSTSDVLSICALWILISRSITINQLLKRYKEPVGNVVTFDKPCYPK